MTLVFTDIVDSTAQAEAMGDRKWVERVARHDSVIREVTESHGGAVVKMLGDGSMLAFDSARAAIRASVDIQRAFEAEQFSVRIGVHAGDVVRSENDILGLTVNKAARVAAATEGGTIMASSTVIDLVGSLQGVESGDAVTVTLKGLSGTHRLVPIEWSVPPTRT
jgi:class 3 adenylate cyclase